MKCLILDKEKDFKAHSIKKFVWIYFILFHQKLNLKVRLQRQLIFDRDVEVNNDFLSNFYEEKIKFEFITNPQLKSCTGAGGGGGSMCMY